MFHRNYRTTSGWKCVHRPPVLFSFGHGGSVGTDYLIISTQIIVCISEFYKLIHHSFKAFLLIPHQLQSQALPPPSQLPTLWLTPMATVQFMTGLITFSACLHFPCLLLCPIIAVFPELIFCQQTTPQNTHIPRPFCIERCWLVRNRWVGGRDIQLSCGWLSKIRLWI